MKVAVVRTGTANLASVLAGLQRAGAEPFVTEDAGVVASERRVVLPGVGAFGAAMGALRASGLADALVARVERAEPLLCVCLGLQMLAVSSEETPGVAGLGVVPGTVTRFRGDVRIPQLGWNAITPTPGARLLQAGHVYFANSYKLDAVPAGWEGATSDHGGPFVAALERGPVLACQFHPELSGAFGQALLSRWLEAAC